MAESGVELSEELIHKIADIPEALTLLESLGIAEEDLPKGTETL